MITAPGGTGVPAEVATVPEPDPNLTKAIVVPALWIRTWLPPLEPISALAEAAPVVMAWVAPCGLKASVCIF